MPTPRRRNATTPKDKPTDTPKNKERLNVRVESDSYKRLMIHCLMTGEQPGEIVTGWIDLHCKEWKLPASNHVSVKPSDRPDSTVDVNTMGASPT
jgi:hypothetical protein